VVIFLFLSLHQIKTTMPPFNLAAVLLLLFLILPQTHAHASIPATLNLNYTKVLLTSAAKEMGAVCLDGTPVPLYLRAGNGEDASKIILFFEGGGWGESDIANLGRANTALGSSNFNCTTYNGRDLLDANCVNNPTFCNYSVVYAAYVDGASRAGDVTNPIIVDGKTIYYRGWRVLKATLAAMLQPNGPGAGVPSLSTAPQLLISGSSAGGLTTFLHVDYIADTVRVLNPTIEVRAVPEVGFFIDGESIWNQQHIMTSVFARVAEIQNITGGDPEQVNKECVAAYPATERYKCFMAQYLLPFIKTPLFIINSMVDQWQTQNILAPNIDTEPSVSTYAPFVPCINNPVAGCNATQAAQWMNYGTQFLTALNTAIKATPSQYNHGGFITSCPIHTTFIGSLGHKITINNTTMYQALTDWVTGKTTSSWLIDVNFPGDKTCPNASHVQRFD
jgi:O-palmitoleoyl-L-serine hydrolase